MATRYDVLRAAGKYDGSPTAHEDVIATLKKHGHNVKASDAWCTETIMAIFYDAGAIDLIGGYAQVSGTLRTQAKKKGIWHDGSKGILPGDIVVFGRNGKPNHTELAVGADLDLSGNYNDGCSRRKVSGRTIIGYVRPKYAETELDNLGVTILASETILGTYGSGKVRLDQLGAFGAKNAVAIQDEVDRVWDDTDKTVSDLAVYCIADMAGRDKYRKKRLGLWADSVQAKINDIHALAGKSIEQAAEDVLVDKYGTGAVRRRLLAFNGYDAEKVQEAVNKALQMPSEPSGAMLISLFRDKGRPTKDVDGLQGNCFIIKQAGYALVVDTMASGAVDKILAEIKSCKTVDLYLSHMHSDHTGNAAALLKTGKIRRCYVQRRDTVHKDYQARYDSIVSNCKKYGTDVIVLRQDSVFDCGGIRGAVLFQQIKADSVNMRSLCTLFAMDGKSILYCGDHHTGTKESAFRLDRHVDVYLSAHHGLYTGDKEDFIKEITPDWIIRNGWKSWPLGTIEQDPKTKAADKIYQKYGNLLPADICGRIQLDICADGTINAHAEKGMKGTTISTKAGKKTVHTCEKCDFHRVRSMGEG